MTRNGLTCLDNGPNHSWASLGLDVRNDKLVSVKRCVWCKREQYATYKPAREEEIVAQNAN